MPPVSAIMCRMTRTRSRKTPALTPPRRVVVALRMAGIAGQDKLNGIFEHLSAGHRWQLIIYRTRLEDAIAYAKALKDLGRVYGENEWQSPTKVGTLAKLQNGVQIKCHTGPKLTKFSDDNSYANLYAINTCPSYFNRDYLGKVLPR